MWELIRANQRRSTILVIVMLGLLLGVGWVIGAVVAPWGMAASDSFADPEGQVQFPSGVPINPIAGMIGMFVAFVLWCVQALVAYYFGGKILLAVSGARKIEKADHPQLFNVVEEMTIAAQLPRVPDIYIIDDPSMNAFATGRDPMHSAVAVTTGLLGRMNRDQLQGVIAHEVSHIVHRDVLYMTMVSIMMGTIIILCEAFFHIMRAMSNGSRYTSRSRKDSGGAIILVIFVVALLLYLIAPLLAQMIYFAISRRREYLADAGGAIYTRYPEGLASALEVLGGEKQPLSRVSKATAPMYITNPFAGKMSLMMSTHPPVEERVKILRGMTGLAQGSGQVSYAAYEQAYEKAKGGKQIIPHAAMGMASAVLRSGVLTPNAEAEAQARQARQREVGDLVRTLNDFRFLACACGMRVKVPADYRKEQIACPRCGSTLQVVNAVAADDSAPPPGPTTTSPTADTPNAEIRVATPRRRVPGQAPQPMAGAQLPPLDYQRKGGGWESVRCSCGTIRNIAPSFTLPEIACTGCGRRILLHPPA